MLKKENPSALKYIATLEAVLKRALEISAKAQTLDASNSIEDSITYRKLFDGEPDKLGGVFQRRNLEDALSHAKTLYTSDYFGVVGSHVAIVEGALKSLSDFTNPGTVFPPKANGWLAPSTKIAAEELAKTIREDYKDLLKAHTEGKLPPSIWG